MNASSSRRKMRPIVHEVRHPNRRPTHYQSHNRICAINQSRAMSPAPHVMHVTQVAHATSCTSPMTHVATRNSELDFLIGDPFGLIPPTSNMYIYIYSHMCGCQPSHPAWVSRQPALPVPPTWVGIGPRPSAPPAPEGWGLDSSKIQGLQTLKV